MSNLLLRAGRKEIIHICKSHKRYYSWTQSNQLCWQNDSEDDQGRSSWKKYDWWKSNIHENKYGINMEQTWMEEIWNKYGTNLIMVGVYIWIKYNWWNQLEEMEWLCNKYGKVTEQIWIKFDQGRSLWTNYDWWRHLEEMKNALGRKVLVGDEKLFWKGKHSSSSFW